MAPGRVCLGLALCWRGMRTGRLPDELNDSIPSSSLIELMRLICSAMRGLNASISTPSPREYAKAAARFIGRCPLRCWRIIDGPPGIQCLWRTVLCFCAKERSQQSAFFRWCQFCCHKAMLFKRSFSNACVFALAMLQSWCELSRICPDGVQAGWNIGGTCQSH